MNVYQPDPQLVYNFDPQELSTSAPGLQSGGDGSWSAQTFVAGDANPVVKYTNDPEPTTQLFGQPDEDFWPNPVASVPATTWLVLPGAFFHDETIVQQPSTTLAPDEDFWVNGVSPVAPSCLFLLPYQPDPEELPAGNFVTEMGLGTGDGSWSSQTLLYGPNGQIVVYNFDPQDVPGIVQAVPFQADEDHWVYLVPPVIPEPTILWLADDWAINPQFDEDFWANAVSPVAANNLFPQPAIFETNEFEPAPTFSGTADEDFWQNWVVAKQRDLRFPQQWEFEPGETATFFGQFDEDFWTNPVAPQAAALFQSFPYFFFDEPILVPQVPGDDSEFWQNWVQPIADSLYQKFPYWFEEDNWVPQPVIAPTGNGGYLVYGLQLINRHVSHI